MKISSLYQAVDYRVYFAPTYCEENGLGRDFIKSDSCRSSLHPGVTKLSKVIRATSTPTKACEAF